MEAKRNRPKWGEPGSRVIRRTASTVFSQGARREVIVTVYPNGLIGLRLHKTRKEEIVCADMVYRDAVIDRVAYEKRKKKGKK